MYCEEKRPLVGSRGRDGDRAPAVPAGDRFAWVKSGVWLVAWVRLTGPRRSLQVCTAQCEGYRLKGQQAAWAAERSMRIADWVGSNLSGQQSTAEYCRLRGQQAVRAEARLVPEGLWSDAHVRATWHRQLLGAVEEHLTLQLHIQQPPTTAVCPQHLASRGAA